MFQNAQQGRPDPHAVWASGTDARATFIQKTYAHLLPEDKYVGAALGLFASVALMFYYVLILFLNNRD